MSGPNLYELSGTLRAILVKLDAAADDGAGEIPAAIEQELDDAAGNFAAKVDGVLRARVNLVAQAEGVDVEIKRLTAMRDGFARRAEWLRAYVFRAMLATGQQKLETKLFRVSVARNAQPSVRLDDGADIPAEFARKVEYVELNKPAVLVAWKAARAAMGEYEQAETAMEQAQLDSKSDPEAMMSLADDCEQFRAKAMELALPPCVHVVEGSHLRIR
jgi:hypothetical protein